MYKFHSHVNTGYICPQSKMIKCLFAATCCMNICVCTCDMYVPMNTTTHTYVYAQNTYIHYRDGHNCIDA